MRTINKMSRAIDAQLDRTNILRPLLWRPVQINNSTRRWYVPSAGKVWKDLVHWFGKRCHLGSGQTDRQLNRQNFIHIGSMLVR